jgi:sugar lactone lactonase YvrE
MLHYFIIFFSIFIIATGCTTNGLKTDNAQLSENPSIVWPPSPQKPRIKFIRSISNSNDLERNKPWFKNVINSLFGKEDADNSMLRPLGVFVQYGKIYVTDPGLFLVHIFDLKEQIYLQIEKAEKDDLVSPIGICVDANEEIFLSDSFLKRVIVLDKNGKYLRDIGSPELFTRPTGIALSKDRVYVVDTLSHQLLVFSKNNGNLLFRIGKNGSANGEFHYPTHIFISKNNLIYVTDSLNFRVQVFDTDGNFLSSFGKAGDAPGNFSKPKGIAIDSEDHIYIADSQFDNVQIFDQSGKLLLVFGSSGSSKGKMSLPAGIFIDDKDLIYVVDSYNRRIQIFQYLKDDK